MLWEAAPVEENVEQLGQRGMQSTIFDPCGNVPNSGDFMTVMQQNAENLSKVYAHRDTASDFVIAEDTVYYKIGPQQAQPPDGTFRAGTRVTLIREAGSYSLVRSADGTRAYVVGSALKGEGN